MLLTPSPVTNCHALSDPLPLERDVLYGWSRYCIVLHLYIYIALLSAQSALEFCPIHCPNGRLGQDLGFGGIAFALKLPELLNGNLAVVRAKLGQTSCFPNGPQIWCPIGQ